MSSEHRDPPALVDQFRAALISCGFTPKITTDGNDSVIEATTKSYYCSVFIKRLPDPEQIADAMIDQAQGAAAWRLHSVDPEGDPE